MLLLALQKAGAEDLAATLSDRAAVHATLDDPEGIAVLLLVLRDAEDADEGGVHDADGKSDESGGVVSKVSATSARCLLDRSQGRTQQAGLCLRAGEAGQRAGGSREWRWRVSLPGTRSAAGPGSAP
jgi:hypothetical protein